MARTLLDYYSSDGDRVVLKQGIFIDHYVDDGKKFGSSKRAIRVYVNGEMYYELSNEELTREELKDMLSDLEKIALSGADADELYVEMGILLSTDAYVHYSSKFN